MFRFCLLLALALGSPLAHAHDYQAGQMFIEHPWSRPTAPGMPMGVAYFTLTNRGDTDDALIAATTPVAARVEFHQSSMVDGIARMRPLQQVVVPAGRTVKVEPGGIHLMLVQLNRGLPAGSEIPLMLEFRVAGKIDVRVKVEARDQVAIENEMTRSIGTVIVVARRPSTLPVSIPTTIEGITAENIATSINAADAPDVLKYFPSLNVRKRYIGDFDHAVLASRASGSGNSARSLVYADGILLSNLLGNGASYTPRWGLVTPEEIDRVDVLFGPFSAAYPGNSVGAVVDYVTRMPQEFTMRGSVSQHTEHFGIYGDDRDFDARQYSASLGNRHGDTSWWLNVNRLDSDGHPMAFGNKIVSTGTPGTGGIPVTGAVAARNPRNQEWWMLGPTSAIHTVQDHAKLKLAHEFGEDGRLSYTFGWWRNDAARESLSWLRDAAGNPIYSGAVNIDGRVFNLGPTEIAPSRNELTHMIHGLSARGRWQAWELEGTASLYDYASDLTRSPDAAQPASLNGGPGRVADSSGTGWTTLHLRARRHGKGQGAHLVEFGVQDDRYELDTEVRATPDWLRDDGAPRLAAFGGETRLTSLYAQDSFDFAERWEATLGARLERWHASSGSISNATSTLRFGDRQETFLSPKGAVAYSLSPDWSLKASMGRAIRMPTVAELFQGSISADTIVNNDPGLAPERSWTQELSLTGEFDHGDLRATFFFEDSRDALYSQVNVASGATVTTIQNVDHIRTRGLELTGHLRGFGNVDLSASLTYAHSRILENANNPATVGKWQPRVPEWRATALATWRPVARFSASLGARYSGRQYNQLDNGDVHGMSYTGFSRFLVFDTRLRYEFADHWAAALGMDNLGNERYWAFHPYTRRSYSAELAFTL